MWATTYKAYTGGVQQASTTISTSNVSSGTVGVISWTGIGCSYSSSRVNIEANGSITFTASSGYNITKIVIISGSSDFYYGTWTSNPSVTPTGNNSGTTTFDGLEANSVTVTTSTAFRCTSASSISIYYAAVSSNTCATPTFSPAAGTFTSAQNVTISCTTDGATIHYTTDGSDPTSSSSTYSSAINVDATKTIKAIAVKDGMTNSQIASATYTILAQKTIAEARTQGTGAVYTRGVITSVSAKTAYIQDANAGISVYGDANLTVVKGDDVTIVGTLAASHGQLRITNPEITVNSQNNTVTPVVKTVAEIKEDNEADKALQGILVRIENATVTAIDGTKVTIVQSSNSIDIFGVSYGSVSVGNVISLTGNVAYYDALQIANPSDIVLETPTITLDKKSFSFGETGGDESITVSYDKMNTATLDIITYESNGTTPATYDWLTTNFDASNNVEFSVAANTGSARTAYFKIFGKGNDNSDTYSELITVTQAAYTTPAILPFAWAGGVIDDLEALDGVSSHNIGTDYAVSNAPYRVKFDGTGDYILIKTNTQPGKVTIGVKKIGGVGNSTLTVQGSSDGTNFTNIQAFYIQGSQNAIVSLETTNAFATTDRYVRIYFTQVTSGNVGVGPISIAIPEPNAPTGDEDDEMYLTTSDNMDGWRAFYHASNSYSVDGNTKVYVADADPVGTTITLKALAGIPANVPVILHTSSSADSHKMTLTKETEAPYTYTNDNKLSWETTAVTDKYRLGFGASGVGFYPYSGTPTSGAVILNVDSSTSGARELTIGFEDETTGLSEIKNTNLTNNTNEFFDLQGRKVAQPTKGMYIVNGKKVIIK